MEEKLNKIFRTEANKRYLFLVLMSLMTLVVYLLYNPLCKGYDFNYHYNRFYTLMEAIKDGSFPYYMDYYVVNGFGYLCKIFYSDLLLIPFALIGLVIGGNEAFNLMLSVSTFLSGWSMYLSFSKITKNSYGAIIAGILYACATYRLFDIYVRSAIGESLAITFIPLILWGIYEMIEGNYKKWYILTIGMTLIIYTHLLSAYILTIILLLTTLINIKKLIATKQRIKYLAVASICTFLLSIYYLVPMFEAMIANQYYFNVYSMVPQVHSYNANQVLEGMFKLFNAPKDGYFPNLGVLVILPPLLLRVGVSRKDDKIVKLLDIFLIVVAILLLMITHLFPWHIYPLTLLKTIQFSHRVNPIITLLLVFCTAYYISIIAKTNINKLIALVILIIINLIAINGDSRHYMYFTCKHEIPNIEVESTHMAILGAEYLPAKFPMKEGTPTAWSEIRGKAIKKKNETTLITHYQKNKGHLTFNVELKEKDNLELPLTYYIGYKATLDGNEIAYQQSENGLIEVPITASGKVEIKYVGTTLQHISLWITIASIILLTIFVVRSKWNVNKINK